MSLIPESLRDRRLDAERWSVAEVLEHLYRVETGVTRLLTRRLERAKAAGAVQERDVSSLLGSLDSFGDAADAAVRRAGAGYSARLAHGGTSRCSVGRVTSRVDGGR